MTFRFGDNFLDKGMEERTGKLWTSLKLKRALWMTLTRE